MKKFFAAVIIVVFAGAAAFFLGWTQIAVPPGAYGVLRSKSHGVAPQLIRAGEFQWAWYRLIPTNAKISVFRITPVNREINAGGELPSGGTYAAFAGNAQNAAADFAWRINLSFSFSLRPDALIGIVRENNIATQDELSGFEQNLADSIEAFMLRQISTEEKTAELENLMLNSSDQLELMVKEQFPVIENFSCLVKSASYPNFALYQQARGLYEDFLKRQRELVSASTDPKAASRVDAQFRFSELERYGELLTKYPILLQYLAQERALKEAE
jgi:hypothetical protein